MKNLKIAAIIPARMASSRFPGKPLLEIHGLPMIEHVRRRTLLCREFSDVVVATCDKEIYDTIKHYGGKVIMTSADHIMASDRVAEVMNNLDCTHVVNVQGDEILVLPEDLSTMVRLIKDNPLGMVWNAVADVESDAELADSSFVKCVVTRSGKVMYCARDFSYLNFENNFDPVKIIIGVLGYSRKGLLIFSKLPRSPIEILASIDQSRVIENDIPLIAVPFSAAYPGINYPREVPIVKNIIEKDSCQRVIMNKIMNWNY